MIEEQKHMKYMTPNRKMLGINSILSLIALNLSGLNSIIKSKILKDLINIIHAHKICNLNSKTNFGLKQKY